MEPDAAAREALTTLLLERGVPLWEEQSDGTLAASDRRVSLAEEAAVTGIRARQGGESTAHTVLSASGLVHEPLEPGRELGRGGMGVVRSAWQGTLRREVAVKQVAREATPSRLANLLKEAWVGGLLEHPNVVPVHVLAHLEGGPAVVMKRIDGTAWRAFIREPERLPAADRDDPLAFHLRVLLAVTNAVALAHDRGVLHLDLKPDNVMCGAHGEVYVVDWGLAAGYGELAPAWLPRAAELRSVAGTPDYMAPELALGNGAAIGPATDVYLLGATLHEALTGAPPHKGTTAQKLFAALRGPAPVLDEAVPRELAAILTRAMEKDPGARYASIPALRGALEDFLAHRAGERFVAQAEGALEALAASRADELLVWGAFGACRFALSEARAAWAEHPRLRELQDALQVEMARFALAHDRLALAESYLTQLSGDLAPELRRELAARRAAAQDREARVAALEALAKEQDLTQGSLFRRRIALALGLLFAAVNFAMGAVERAGLASLGYREMLVTGALTVLGVALYGLPRRGVLLQNHVNASFFAICVATLIVVQGYWLVGLGMGVPFASALALTPMFYLLAFGAMTVLVSGRFALSPLLQVPTLVLAALYPAWRYEIIGIGGGLGAALVGLVWPVEAATGRAEIGP